MNLYIVTGTTRGLGQALAAAIAREPSNERIEIARAPDAALAGGRRFEADLGDTGALAAACERIEEHLRGRAYGKAVLINNAGVVEPVAPLDRADPAALERNLVVNLVAPVLLMRWFLHATGHIPLRRIINISSGAGRRPIFGWGAYCTSKAGIDMASRVAALEAKARGQAVEVVSLAPGIVDTGMQATVRGKTAEDFVDVERFRQMKERGELSEAAAVAADILALEAAGKLRGDAVLDIRKLER